jgi:hypothetical protein
MDHITEGMDVGTIAHTYLPAFTENPSFLQSTKAIVAIVARKPILRQEHVAEHEG